MAEIRWYKRDPDAALSGMMHLSLEERGAYNTVLDLIYARANKLPDDDRFICGWLRCDIRVWKRIKAKLIEDQKLYVEGGLLRNFRATSEILTALSSMQLVSEANRSKGIKSGEVRRKNKNLSEPSVEPTANIPTPTPTPTPIKEAGIGSARANSLDLEARLREAADWQNEPHPNLAVTGQIEALIAAGANMDLDVLPTVRALAPRANGRSSWKYFVKAIAQARDDRIAASKIVSPNGGFHGNRTGNSQRRVTTAESLAATFGRGHGEGDPLAGDSGPGDGTDKADRRR